MTDATFKPFAQKAGELHWPNEATVFDDWTGDYEFLSEDYPCVIAFDGVNYPSLTHAFFASKNSGSEGGLNQRAVIQNTRSAYEVKKLMKGFNASWRWRRQKIKVRYAFQYAKFANNPTLRAALIATAPAQLVFKNDHLNRFWGVCQGEGKNWDGRLLMSVRDQLIAEDAGTKEPHTHEELWGFELHPDYKVLKQRKRERKVNGGEPKTKPKAAKRAGRGNVPGFIACDEFGKPYAGEMTVVGPHEEVTTESVLNRTGVQRIMDEMERAIDEFMRNPKEMTTLEHAQKQVAFMLSVQLPQYEAQCCETLEEFENSDQVPRFYVRQELIEETGGYEYVAEFIIPVFTTRYLIVKKPEDNDGV